MACGYLLFGGERLRFESQSQGFSCVCGEETCLSGREILGFSRGEDSIFLGKVMVFVGWVVLWVKASRREREVPELAIPWL